MIREAVFEVGIYVVYRGKLSGGDSRDYWIEGVDVNGRRCPVASCWNEGDAIRRAEEMAERDEANRLRSAMQSLSAEHRAALALRYDGGLTFAQAATALGEPVTTVKSRTGAAIARLRALLTAQTPPAERPEP